MKLKRLRGMLVAYVLNISVDNSLGTMVTKYWLTLNVH